MKRCKCIARLQAEIVKLDDSKTAKKHSEILRNFYSSIESYNYCDSNQKGDLRQLILQVLSCVTMKYSVHKIAFERKVDFISAKFVRYPLWIFENTDGVLRLLERESQFPSICKFYTSQK